MVCVHTLRMQNRVRGEAIESMVDGRVTQHKKSVSFGAKKHLSITNRVEQSFRDAHDKLKTEKVRWCCPCLYYPKER